MKFFFYLLVVWLSILCTAPFVYAVDSNSETAGAESTRFEKEKELAQAVLKDSFDGEKKSTVESSNDAVVLSAEDEKVKFKLNAIHVSGNAQFSSDELLASVQDKIGKEVSIGDLRRIASQIKKYYRDLGFIAAYVYVPPQSIEKGIVEIVVIEGVLEKIEIKNNHWFSEKVLRRFINLVPSQILYLQELQSALIFLNKHKDIKVKSLLKPGDQGKTTKLVLDVTDRFPIHFSADVNNLGTQNTGRTRTGLSLSLTNLTGNMDELSSRFQIGSGAVAVGVDYSVPVHASGTRVGFGYSYSHIKVGGALKALHVTGDAHVYSPYILQPVFRREWAEVTLNTGMDFKETKNYVLGTQSGDDSLRIWNLGLNLEFMDRWGKTFFPHSFHIGFSGFLGASAKLENSATRVGTGGQFTIYRNSLIRYQRLPWGLMYVFREQMQLSNDRLPPSEQFRLGGAFSVRGYSEGEYLADYGALMTHEIYVPSYFFSRDFTLPYSKEPARQQIQGVAFFDFGGGALRQALSSEKNSRTLAGAGLGVRMHLFNKVFARIQWATPTGGSPHNGDDSAFYYGVASEFF